MSNVQEINQKAQEQTLDVVRKTQDAAVDAVTTWTEPPTRSPRSCPISPRATRSRGSPSSPAVPSAAEIIDADFDFAQQILTSQREFAHRIVAATNGLPNNR